MGLCPLFQCSFCLQGLGPFGGPCVPWEAELWSPLRLGSMGKHPRSTCITWRIAEVLGLAWLSLKGVCVLCFNALSACKGWGHVVAPVRPGREVLGLVWLSLKRVCVCVSFVSVLFLLARVGAIWWPLCTLGGSTLEPFAFRCDRDSRTCLPESQRGVCVRCFSALSAFKGWGHLVAPVRSGRLIFDVFEAVGVTFWSILASFWEAGAPCGHLPGSSGS
jgi:hypothetical protein